jgi:hypothetical protein
MELPHDDRGLLITDEPICLWWTEWDLAKGRTRPASYYTPEIWRCREHPDWQGEDLPESRIAEWEAIGQFRDWPGGPRKVWEEESVQAHAEMHPRLRDVPQR